MQCHTQSYQGDRDNQTEQCIEKAEKLMCMYVRKITYKNVFKLNTPKIKDTNNCIVAWTSLGGSFEGRLFHTTGAKVHNIKMNF